MRGEKGREKRGRPTGYYRKRRETEMKEEEEVGAGSGRTRVQAWRLWHAAQVGMVSITHSQAWALGPQW